MKPDPDTTCPATLHSDKCRDHYANCPKWMNVLKADEKGQPVDDWACSDVHNIKLQVELIKLSSQTRASVDKVANEVNTTNMQQDHLLRLANG